MSFVFPINASSLPGLFRGPEGHNVVGLSVALGALVVVATFGSQLFRKTDEDGVPYNAGIPFIGSWGFITRRHEFTHNSLKRLGNVFSFNILHHKVLMVSGEEARNTFFSHKRLHVAEGYVILFGGAPSLVDIDVSKVTLDEEANSFEKQIIAVLRRDRLAKTLPLMLGDLERISEAWGSSGKFNPLDDIYNAVLQLTVRAAACKEIADDPVAVKRLAKLYWAVEKGTTPASLLLPWLPSAARRRKREATAELYMMLKEQLDKRKEEGQYKDDAVQALLDEGDDVNTIIQFIFGALFAGILNTGIMASWLTLFLGANPEWKAKVIAEVRSFVAKHVTPRAGSTNVVAQLSQVPASMWDDEMQSFDQCLRETIRIVMTGSTLRRALPGRDGDEAEMVFGGHKVKPGTFLAFPVTSIHLDPEVYPDPLKWDPSRFDRGEDKKQHWAFVGWGVGRHPCPGMRLARIEVKLIIALFLMQYEYELVDGAGKQVTVLPEPDRSNMYQVLPKEPVYVKYTRVQT